jgi:uridine phosphorylase
MRKEGVLNFEMEMSVYLTLAQISTYKIRAGGLCAVFANRVNGAFISPGDRKKAEMCCLKVGLLAVELLYARDEKEVGK